MIFKKVFFQIFSIEDEIKKGRWKRARFALAFADFWAELTLRSFFKKWAPLLPRSWKKERRSIMLYYPHIKLSLPRDEVFMYRETATTVGILWSFDSLGFKRNSSWNYVVYILNCRPEYPISSLVLFDAAKITLTIQNLEILIFFNYRTPLG